MDHLKTPVISSLQAFSQNKINDAIQLTGKALPCSVVTVAGPIVQVKFELNTSFTLPQVTMPIFGSEYIRLPIQPGCKGVCFPIDVYLGGISGLGGGTADFSQRANLSTLVFFPVGSKNFSPTDDPNSVVIYGPDGVILRDINSASTVTVSPGVITMDSPMVRTTGNLAAGNGVTGTATYGQTITFDEGIATNIY